MITYVLKFTLIIGLQKSYLNEKGAILVNFKVKLILYGCIIGIYMVLFLFN